MLIGTGLTKRYGINDVLHGVDVRVSESLIFHFRYGGAWSGPESQHLAGKRDEARTWLTQSQSPKVQAWLTRYIDFLGEGIESAQIDEERRF